MCTVTFIPKPNNGFILTSNRDEAPGRDTLTPKIYREEDVLLLYPKDAVAGGTWIGISEKKRAVSLMNGGFKAHIRKSHYRKSRGIVVKDFLIADDLTSLLTSYNFDGIEPFTAVVVEWTNNVELFTLVWDGENLHTIKEANVPKIWSSSPLYPETIKLEREQWFSVFLSENENVLSKEILRFHKTAGEGNLENGLIMDRGFVKTKSITQIVKNGDRLEMRYEDFQLEEPSTLVFEK